MVMLSRLRRFALVDVKGRHGKLVDFAVALLDGDYPPVTHLFFLNEKKEQVMLSWDSVASIDWQACRINVNDLDQAEVVPSEPLKDTVMLRGDILDALVIDLQNRRVTRANDLSLEEDDGRLQLRAADTGSRAVLRRLTRGKYGHARRSALYDWKYVEFLRGDPQAVKNGAGYHLRIARLPPGEIARLTDPLPYLHAAELITLLPDPKATDTLEAMSPERQLQVFEELDEEQALRLLTLMAPDVAADLVGRLQTGTMRHYLESLPQKQSERIIDLLRYPEDTVGGIMTNDVVYVPIELTVAEARVALREPLKESDFVFLIYVVEDEEKKKLRGLISLRSLLTSDDEQKMEEIMDPYVSTLRPLESASDAAYRVINSHMAAMPVVGEGGRLLGVVTVDAAVARVAPANWSAQAPRVFS
jgi:magnesium transporter